MNQPYTQITDVLTWVSPWLALGIQILVHYYSCEHLRTFVSLEFKQVIYIKVRI